MHRQPTVLTISGIRKLQTKLRLLRNRYKSLTLALQERDDDNDLLDIKRIERDIVMSDITKLQAILSNVTILTKVATPDQASQGTKVTYLQDTTGYRHKITLVDPHEADPFEGLVSVQSPVGSSLLGHRVGDTVSVTTSKGSIHLTILELE